MSAPRLIVVIDTEEDWLAEHLPKAPITNVASVADFQATIADPLGIRPLYLANYPVASDPHSQAMFRELIASGVCELGSHVHNWNSPPFTDEDVRVRSYHTDIDPELEKQKIADVTHLINDHIGVQPVCFRGGRWGVNGRTIRSLQELGYRVDTSVHPVTDFTDSDGGPDYFGAPLTPYFPSTDDHLTPDPNADPANAILELPVTIGFSRPPFEARRRRLQSLYNSALARRCRLVGLSDLLGFTRRIKLSPETATFADMKTLASACISEGHDLLHLTFHSCMLAVGTSPYSMTARERDERIAHLRDFLSYAINDIGAVPVTPSEYRDGFAATG